MIGPREEDPLLRAAPRVVQAPRVGGRNDPVAFAGEREEGRVDGRRLREGVEGVPEHERHRNEGVVPLADPLQAVEGGDEEDAPYRSRRGERHRDRTPDAPAEDDDALRVDVLALGEPVVDDEGVRDERGLARPPLAQPVAAVVERRQ